MSQTIAIAEGGELTQPNLHDARVRAVILCDAHLMRLPFETGGGQRGCLVFHGVERLRVDDFKEGNIVLDVTVSTGASINSADVSFAYDLEDVSDILLSEIVERLRKQHQLVVRVNPTYGCTVVCVCRNLEYEDGAGI